MKRKFERWDCVELSNPYQEKYRYGYIQEYDRKSKNWTVRVKEVGELIHIAADELTYIPPYLITEDFLKKIIRYEYTYADYEKMVIPDGNWDCDVEYEYSLDDMVALINNIRKNNPTNDEICKWAELVSCDFEMFYWVAGDMEHDEREYPKNDAAVANSIFTTLCNFAFDEMTASLSERIDFQRIIADIDNCKAGRPVKCHLWSLGNKIDALEYFEHAAINTLTAEEKDELRNIILELTDFGNARALHAMGYAYYGGNEIFPCDWEKSRDCFLKLMEMDNVSDLDKCQYANTLGYIFYYGRCNDGVPEYEKAYMYFSLGAAGGMYESMYKLSDMYAHGYGVTKNTRAAATLVNMVYTENLCLIKKGNFDCQFADAALRMGNLCRDGIIHEDAYEYYTLADFAIRKRIPYDHYGDANVFSAIQKELDNIRKDRPLKKAASITENYAFEIFCNLFYKHSCYVTVQPVKNGIKITAKRLPKPGKENVKPVFECYTEYGYCDLVDKVSMNVFGPKLPLLEEKRTFIADGFDWDWTNDGLCYTFTHHDEEIFSFVGEKFVRKLPKRSKAALKEYRFASVVFNNGGRAYDYICELPDASVGDKVVVFANGEEKEVEIVRLFSMCIGDMPLAVERYKKY